MGNACTLETLAAGASRTEEWTFVRDVTYLGRGTHQCMARTDTTDTISESDEINNNSPLFTLVTPWRPAYMMM